MEILFLNLMKQKSIFGIVNMEREERIQKEIYYVRKYVVSHLSHNIFKTWYYYLKWQYYKRINEKEFEKNDKMDK